MAQTGRYAVDDRQVQLVIRALVGHHIHSHRHTQRVERGQHHLDLEQAVLGDLPVAAGGGAIHTHGAGGEVVDAQDVLVERTLAGGPAGIVTEAEEDIRHAVVGQVGGRSGCGSTVLRRVVRWSAHGCT